MDGFINLQLKSIEYKNVTSVNLRKGFFQGMYGVGSIVLMTPSSGIMMYGQNMNSMASLGGIIVLANIENPEAIYENIQSIIRSEQNPTTPTNP